MTWFTALAVVAMALAVWLVALPRVRVADPDAPRFGALVSRRSTVWVGATAAAVSGVLWLVPSEHHWLWVPYLAVGVPLVAVDLLTTFLPKQLNHLGGLLMLAGLVPLGLADWRAAAGAVVGGAAALAFFYLAWRVAATLGFGDVRLAALIGAVAGQSGVGAWTSALLAGTLLGALHGIAHALWARRSAGRPKHFPFGPALWLGPVVAAVPHLNGG